MNPVGEPRVAIPESLRALYAPVEEELEAVEEVLRRELSSENPFVDRLARHGFRLGGKRLRPALVLLSAAACGGIRPEHLPLAAMVEVLHTATLIHDDVLDEATMRRHLDTVNVRWNNETSVLLGDFLLAEAFCVAASVEDARAWLMLGEASRRTCEGELRQIASRGQYDLSEDDYLDIIASKTGELTSASCRLGAHLAGAGAAEVELLGQYGRDLGIAFQIADDLLDLVGDESTVGKSLGTDLEKHKPTLPLLRALAGLDPGERAERLAAMDRGDQSRGQLVEWLGRAGAIQAARGRAVEFAQRAAARLDRLAPSPARESLEKLAEFVVQRQQ